ncbi:MAG: hypothetical protein V9E87_11325 [Gemmatimonadales bacterium]
MFGSMIEDVDQDRDGEDHGQVEDHPARERSQPLPLLEEALGRRASAGSAARTSANVNPSAAQDAASCDELEQQVGGEGDRRESDSAVLTIIATRMRWSTVR